MYMTENQLNTIIDSYINGNFQQLRTQLKKHSVKRLLLAFECFEVSQDLRNTILKYKTGIK